MCRGSNVRFRADNIRPYIFNERVYYMKKRFIFITMLSIILILVVILIILSNKTTKFELKEQGFSINYPIAFERISEEDNKDNIVFEAVDEDGIKMLIELVENKRTDKTIEEIMDNYGTTLKIFNLDSEIEVLDKKQVKIGDIIAGRIESKISKDNLATRATTLLIQKNNSEITITISGNEDAINNNEKQIEKIINSIKLY
jgi:hypothetical protein